MRVLLLGLVAVLGLGLGGCPKAPSSSSPSASGIAIPTQVERNVRTEEGTRCESAAGCSGGMACVDNRVRCITAPCDAHFYECRSTCDDQGAGCPEGCTCEMGTRATIDEGQARVCDCPPQPSLPSDAPER